MLKDRLIQESEKDGNINSFKPCLEKLIVSPFSILERATYLSSKWKTFAQDKNMCRFTRRPGCLMLMWFSGKLVNIFLAKTDEMLLTYSYTQEISYNLNFPLYNSKIKTAPYACCIQTSTGVICILNKERNKYSAWIHAQYTCLLNLNDDGERKKSVRSICFYMFNVLYAFILQQRIYIPKIPVRWKQCVGTVDHQPVQIYL